MPKCSGVGVRTLIPWVQGMQGLVGLSIRHVHGGKGDYDIHIEKGSGSGYITMGQ